MSVILTQPNLIECLHAKVLHVRDAAYDISAIVSCDDLFTTEGIARHLARTIKQLAKLIGHTRTPASPWETESLRTFRPTPDMWDRVVSAGLDACRGLCREAVPIVWAAPDTAKVRRHYRRVRALAGALAVILKRSRGSLRRHFEEQDRHAEGYAKWLAARTA